MHPNPAFRKTDRQGNIDFARQHSFGTLAVNSEQSPLLSHIPFQLSEDGRHLEVHLVRSNPIVTLLNKPRSAVLSVLGPDAYISPDWYQVDNQVPTWNYVAVHIRGQLSLLDPSKLRNILENLSADMENRLLPKVPWSLDKLDENTFKTLAKQIVPVAMDVTEINGTWKLAQNKSAEARLSAAAELQNSTADSNALRLADLMRQVQDT